MEACGESGDGQEEALLNAKQLFVWVQPVVQNNTSPTNHSD